MLNKRKRKQTEEERIRDLAEDLLKGVAHRYWLDEAWKAEEVLPRDKCTPLEHALSLELLERLGHVERSEGRWRLTETGRTRAVELLRAHRLMETYLARKAGLPAGELHEKADRKEHSLTHERINELADTLNRPRFDPHGDPIPERDTSFHDLSQIPLIQAAPGMLARIVHIEDEPTEDFERLNELGFALELPVRIVDQTGKETLVELAGEELSLSTALASHIEIAPLKEEESYPENLRRLTALKSGEEGIVEFISAACMGPERRRLQDFGLVPGSRISCDFSSPFGSPIAYSIRGSTLGLRRQQARNVMIRRAQ
jgi:DtxR family Mn-dependent transcriptional regulator